MGNQQERSLAWLAGIVDGEGSISVQVYTLPDGRVRLTPFVGIVNSDIGLVNECRRILQGLGIKVRDCKAVGTNKPCINLRMDGFKAAKAACEALLPYLKGSKRRNAEVVLEYIQGREDRGLERNAKGHIRRVEYSRDEIELVSSIRGHKRAKSSEAICRAPNVLG